MENRLPSIVDSVLYIDRHHNARPHISNTVDRVDGGCPFHHNVIYYDNSHKELQGS